MAVKGALAALLSRELVWTDIWTLFTSLLSPHPGWLCSKLLFQTGQESEVSPLFFQLTLEVRNALVETCCAQTAITCNSNSGRVSKYLRVNVTYTQNYRPITLEILIIQMTTCSLFVVTVSILYSSCIPSCRACFINLKKRCEISWDGSKYLLASFCSMHNSCTRRGYFPS